MGRGILLQNEQSRILGHHIACGGDAIFNFLVVRVRNSGLPFHLAPRGRQTKLRLFRMDIGGDWTG